MGEAYEAAGELLEVEEFFAPSSTDMVDGLIGQYRMARNRVEKVAEIMAGQGGLADHMPKAQVCCVEVSPLHCQILRAKGYADVDEADFIEWARTAPRDWDRVVMNPPFSDGRWRLHLDTAAAMVKPGGRLVAVLPASARGNDLLTGWSLEWSGTIVNEFAGTSVAVVILAATRAAP